MIRLFTPDDLAGREAITITGDQAHYLLNVVRVQVGERFVMVDGGGRQHELIVRKPGKGRLEARIVAHLEPAPSPALHLDLYLAPLKGGNFELVIRQATELGVARIVPTITRRTVARVPADRAEGRVERWRKIAAEAARQCGRGEAPVVEAPHDWLAALADWSASGAPGIMPYEALAGDAAHGLRETLAALKQTPRLAAFIGPEGGFEAGEVDAARAAGLAPVSLGPRVLRAETAAVAVCALIMYEKGS